MKSSNLQESDYNIGHVTDTQSFTEVISCPDRDKWVAAVCDELSQRKAIKFQNWFIYQMFLSPVVVSGYKNQERL